MPDQRDQHCGASEEAGFAEREVWRDRCRVGVRYPEHAISSIKTVFAEQHR